MTAVKDSAMTFTQEGPNVRVIAGRLNFLFTQSEHAVISAAYARHVVQGRAHFAQRLGGDVLEPALAALVEAVAREATLHWMYFYVVNRLAIEITAADWEHPQTRRIICRSVEEKVKPCSAEAAALSARLMGLSVADYQRWRRADEEYVERR